VNWGVALQNKRKNGRNRPTENEKKGGTMLGLETKKTNNTVAQTENISGKV